MLQTERSEHNSFKNNTQANIEPASSCRQNFSKKSEVLEHFSNEGQKLAYVNVGSLTDFWIHTGTACNLSCPSCFEGSNNNPKRLECITFEEAKELLLEAIELGAKSFSFTGGEPFVNKDFIKILDFALQYRPCLVLSNATAPIERHFDALKEFKKKPYTLHVRVSIDYPNKKQHDAERGEGMFARSLQNCAMLHTMGHTISLARRKEEQEDETAINRAFADIFEEFSLPLQTNIVAFPNLKLSAFSNNNPKITEACMINYKTEEERAAFMCSHCLMAAKKDGRLCLYPCTLVDDDEAYILGHTLSEARKYDIIFLGHKRCFTCFAHGTSCVEPS